MSRAGYMRSRCDFCDRDISTAGAARHNHAMTHVRDGYVVREQRCGMWNFKTTDAGWERREELRAARDTTPPATGEEM
jgi:1,2-phenylacetyl-CoA epoxidase PaaB subunit